ncbi:plastocyanin/azurin family copper-binding protein [Ferruginibacter sp. SUN002]|uniref:plastocyanin/azurin family copper-binding protein n=1 Tax=Ferruginibacter sp. SUN002 TaxID=2937789 RepID=UPI003D3631FC
MKKNGILSILFLLIVLITTNIACSKDNEGGGGATNSINITDFAFSSSSITVAKGTTITWTNIGASAHTVTSDDGTSFDSGNLSTGGVFTHTFNTAGTFAYHCSAHPSMTATVIVNP